MQQTNHSTQSNSTAISCPAFVSLKLADASQTKTVSKLLQTCNIELVDDASISIDIFVDGRNLACPQPLLKTKIKLQDLRTGAYLYMVATDSNSMHDIVAFAKQKKLNLLNWQGNNVYHFLIKT
ncbi:MAG: hypothetical protein CSA42_04310 [Gammaproteobacteria bacterium]|nr:MAG: hypothetical protein CSA42_04310 [Gammaproteobacteria bacterium]